MRDWNEEIRVMRSGDDKLLLLTSKVDNAELERKELANEGIRVRNRDEVGNTRYLRKRGKTYIKIYIKINENTWSFSISDSDVMSFFGC